MANKNVFNAVPVNKPNKNVFDLSHDLKYSFNMGELIPTCVIDTVPGDSFQIGFENMLRFSALLAPVMHRVKVTTHYFFVPNRILYRNRTDWEDFITGTNERLFPDLEWAYFKPQTFAYLDPENESYGTSKGSLCDYMGVPIWTPTAVPFINEFKLDALPFMAYWRIWLEYYSDQNNDSAWALRDNFGVLPGDNTNNTLGDVSSPVDGTFGFLNGTRVAPRAWGHDYFTSALPQPQKGEDVFIPLSAPVVAPFTDGEALPRTPLKVRSTANDFLISSTGLAANASSSLADDGGGTRWISGQVAENTDGDGTIANLRRAIKLQEWLELNNAVGSRYKEFLLGHFGVMSSDKRLDRPEYLGGAIQNMVISEVLSTAQTLNAADEVVNPVGQMAGHGISVGSRSGIDYYCEEHGWIIGLISVMPDTAYQDGIPRKFTRSSHYDYFFRHFELIGDQPIKLKELQANPNWSDVYMDETFGYVPRYSEYKYESSRVAGDFRDELDFWHLGRRFDITAPTGQEADRALLNERFIYPMDWDDASEEVPFDRIFAVPSTTADTIYAFTLNVVRAVRPMAKFGLPRL